MYSNCCCSCLFEPEIIKIGQSSYKMYSNNIVNFQESTTIFKCLYKKVFLYYDCIGPSLPLGTYPKFNVVVTILYYIIHEGQLKNLKADQDYLLKCDQAVFVYQNSVPAVHVLLPSVLHCLNPIGRIKSSTADITATCKPFRRPPWIQ